MTATSRVTGRPIHKMERAFRDFHGENPQVFQYLKAQGLKRRRERGPNARAGVQLLMELARRDVAIGGGQEPKLSNNHSAYYARLLLCMVPELKGMFVLKPQKRQCSFGPLNSELGE